MSKLNSLLRATTSGGLQLFNYQGKTERSKRIMPLILGSLVGILMLFSASVMTSDLKKNGGESVILSLYTLITATIIVMEGSYKSVDLLFKPKDNDMLLAMPIKRSEIIFARIIKFYLFEMVYCLIFLLPAIIAYAINTDVGTSYPLVALTMLMLMPVIPIAISCLVGLLISATSGRFKHKTLLQVLLSFLVLFVMAGIVLLINTTSDFDGQSMIKVGERINNFYYPAATFVELANNFDVWKYLLFVLVNSAILGLTIIAVSRFCFQIINHLSMVDRAKEAGMKYSYVKHGQTFAIVKKELTKYFNTPVLLMNTAIGLVLFAVVVGVICFRFDDSINELMSSAGGFPLTIAEVRSYLPAASMAMAAFASLLTCITATMISLEGRALDTLKALPISGRRIILTKVLAATLLIAPVTVTGTIVLSLRFQFGLLDTVLVLISAVIMPLVTELIGILINLKYPRFDAESDAVVVKQSASVMVATFLGLGMVLLTISLLFAIVFLAGQTAGMAMMDAVFVIVALFLYFVVVMRGEEKYLKLSA